eukprot:TRINITY_DN1004_c0_g2_i6.p1 TRINITY_DN1004_c0_g2~~TRINITY_DN1004_c0_g2_i6.p1  ORF type:complete len:240 (-),score=26.02 TRINITY_DN1004_c0_g2_i6:103-822(-)
MKCLAIISLVLVIGFAQPSPALPETFRQDYIEILNYWFSSFRTSGTFYYNASANASRLDRDNGQWEKFCGTVAWFSNTPCNQYIVNGTMHLVFPKNQYCCNCCSAEHGCGMLPRNLLNKPKFLGIEGNLHNPSAPAMERWVGEINGARAFYYNTENKARVPYILDTGSDKVIFDQRSFDNTRNLVRDLELPTYCGNVTTCPYFSWCTVQRGQFFQALNSCKLSMRVLMLLIIYVREQEW